MGKDKLIQVSKFYGDHSHAYWQAVNRHGHFGSGVRGHSMTTWTQF